jgi:hypothetical protein
MLLEGFFKKKLAQKMRLENALQLSTVVPDTIVYLIGHLTEIAHPLRHFIAFGL